MNKKMFVNALRKRQREINIINDPVMNECLDKLPDDDILMAYSMNGVGGEAMWSLEDVDKVAELYDDMDLILNKLEEPYCEKRAEIWRKMTILEKGMLQEGIKIEQYGSNKINDLTIGLLNNLCDDANIETTMRTLFYINHYANFAKDLLLYADRQGLFKIKNMIMEYMYAKGIIKVDKYYDGSRVFSLLDNCDYDCEIDFVGENITDVRDDDNDYYWDENDKLKMDNNNKNDYCGKGVVKLAVAILGKTDINRDELESISNNDIKRYIKSQLEILEEQALADREPIDIERIRELFFNYDAFPKLSEKVDFLGFMCSDFDDLDESFTDPIFDPEYYSVVSFKYKSEKSEYLFCMPFRLAEDFIDADVLRVNVIYDRIREEGMAGGEYLIGDEAYKVPPYGLLNNLGIHNIAHFCPHNLTDKETYIERKEQERAARRLWDSDDWDNEEDDEYYEDYAPFQDKKKLRVAKHEEYVKNIEKWEKKGWVSLNKLEDILHADGFSIKKLLAKCNLKYGENGSPTKLARQDPHWLRYVYDGGSCSSNLWNIKKAYDLMVKHGAILPDITCIKGSGYWLKDMITREKDSEDTEANRKAKELKKVNKKLRKRIKSGWAGIKTIAAYFGINVNDIKNIMKQEGLRSQDGNLSDVALNGGWIKNVGSWNVEKIYGLLVKHGKKLDKDLPK